MPRTLASAAEPGMAEPPLLEAALAEPPEPVMAEPLVAEPVPAEPTMTLDQMIHRTGSPSRNPNRSLPLIRGRPRPSWPAGMTGPRRSGSAGSVRGQFVPLPPAIAGLAATCLLAVLGLRDLPGILLFTPLVVMLLAAPGKQPPARRPPGLAAPGRAAGRPVRLLRRAGLRVRGSGGGDVSLCAAVALHYLDLATRDPAEGQIPDTRLGWEGRMLAVGLGAMFGIGMVAYLAMTAYLGCSSAGT